VKLLSCPFCGKLPSLFPTDPAREGNAWGEVRCVNERCVTFDSQYGHGVSVDDGSTIADERGTAKYIAGAVRRWNRRADT
jgi:hypothetical protein